MKKVIMNRSANPWEEVSSSQEKRFVSRRTSSGGGGGGKFGKNLEDWGRNFFSNMTPRKAIMIGVVVLGIWLASGLYRVLPDEQGVELLFGRWVQTSEPGLNYRFPWPIGSVIRPRVTRVNKINIGFAERETRAGDRRGAEQDVVAESLMLTGDENIIDIDFSVFWLIKDAGKFLFEIDRPEATTKVVSESVMRDIIGKTDLQKSLTQGRQSIEEEARQGIQETLDNYGAGIEITQVKLQKVDPPNAVIDAFRDVQAAEADRVRLENEAKAYANSIIPEARGQATAVVKEAEAYREQKIKEAEGQTQRYLMVKEEYKKSPIITVSRLYLETMERVFSQLDKISVTGEGAVGGLLPYLPLNELMKEKKNKGQ